MYGRNINLSLETKVDNKPLYKYLFSDKMIEKTKMNAIIESFVKE